MPQERPAARKISVRKWLVYNLRATGAIRGTPAGMKPLTTTNGTEELLRLA